MFTDLYNAEQWKYPEWENLKLRNSPTTQNSSKPRITLGSHVLPVEWHQARVGLEQVNDLLSNAVWQPQLLQLLITLRTQMQRVSAPAYWRKNFNKTNISKYSVILQIHFFCLIKALSIKYWKNNYRHRNHKKAKNYQLLETFSSYKKWSIHHMCNCQFLNKKVFSNTIKKY